MSRKKLGAKYSITKYDDAFGTISGLLLWRFFGSAKAKMVPYVEEQIGPGYGLDNNPFIFWGFVGIKIFPR